MFLFSDTKKPNKCHKSDTGTYIFYEETLKNIDDHINMTIYKNLKVSNESLHNLLSTGSCIDTCASKDAKQDPRYIERGYEGADKGTYCNETVYSTPVSSTTTSQSKSYKFKHKYRYKKETMQETFEKYTKCKKIRNEQIIFLENIRFLILKNLKITRSKKKLLHYHSVIHLLELMLKSEIPYHRKLNEWLNTNYYCNDTVTDLMRGNFENVVKKYPQLKPAFDELVNTNCYSYKSYKQTSCDNTVECMPIEETCNELLYKQTADDDMQCKQKTTTSQNKDSCNSLLHKQTFSVNMQCKQKAAKHQDKEGCQNTSDFLDYKNLTETLDSKNATSFCSINSISQSSAAMIRNKKPENNNFLCLMHYCCKSTLLQKICVYIVAIISFVTARFFTNIKDNEKDFMSQWYNKYVKEMPKEVSRVCNMNFYDKTKHWADVLCHELLFMHRKNGSFIGTKEELNKVVRNNDIFGFILKEDWKRAMEVSDDWLRLILIFVSEAYEERMYYDYIFEQNAKEIYKNDYLLALNYFAYSKNINLYYNFTIAKIKFTFINVYFLYEFAQNNNLEKDKILHLFCKEMFKQKNYYGILSIMNQYEFNYKIDEDENKDFVTFCIENYTSIKRILKTEMMDYDVYNFIMLIVKIRQSKTMQMEELAFLLSSAYNKNFLKEIIDEYLKLDLEEADLHFLLGKVIKNEDQTLKPYKKIVLERFEAKCNK